MKELLTVYCEFGDPVPHADTGHDTRAGGKRSSLCSNQHPNLDGQSRLAEATKAIPKHLNSSSPRRAIPAATGRPA